MSIPNLPLACDRRPYYLTFSPTFSFLFPSVCGCFLGTTFLSCPFPVFQARFSLPWFVTIYVFFFSRFCLFFAPLSANLSFSFLPCSLCSVVRCSYACCSVDSLWLFPYLFFSPSPPLGPPPNMIVCSRPVLSSGYPCSFSLSKSFSFFPYLTVFFLPFPPSGLMFFFFFTRFSPSRTFLTHTRAFRTLAVTLFVLTHHCPWW